MKVVFAVLFFVFIGFPNSNAQTEQEMIQIYFDNLKAKNYNPKIDPVSSDGHGTAIRVLATMHVIDIHKIDDYNMEYQASFYFRQQWNDTRLAFEDMDISSININDDKYIWTPDAFFIQEIDGRKHMLTTPNVFIRIYPNGGVHYSVRNTVTLSCNMDFRNYPHDSQKCNFSVESYSKKSNQLRLDWDSPRDWDPVSATEVINVWPFELESLSYNARDTSLSFGKYRCLDVTFTFKRKIGFYIIKLYVPFIILVILSWISFWIKPKLAVLRVPLLLVIMYIMMNVQSGINCFIPPASYTKASDVWIAVCESLVFAAFLEFIFVSIVSKSEKKMEKKWSSSDPEVPMISDSKVKEKSASSEKMSSAIKMMASSLSKNKKLSTQIDFISRIVFPLLFVLFNLVYWTVY